MKIRTLNSLLKDAPKNLRNNATTSIASIITIMLTVFILALYVLCILNVKRTIIGIYSQFEIQVTLENNIKTTDKQDIYMKIRTAHIVNDVVFENNIPLSASYIIKVTEANDVSKITTKLNGLQGIDKINIFQCVPAKISIIIKLIQLIGFILFLILIIATFFLIKYTLKLAIYPRVTEINIMQYLGATDCFIKLPFIFEGIIIGFVGSVSAVIAIYFLYIFVYKQMNSFISTTSISFIAPSFIFTTISLIFIPIGMVLTSIGSIRVVKKFLTV
ncbi:FtsX-like permease family protein [Clostridium oryzae]|uniref:Cell division protein FtsX n=1 Tax=Clostridium oryzae TaxID=1450648 RepID=A0A1V4ITQ9_9CLOT|nr:FtsX-like permease family protein [Clostridium oryzae]OPJ63174.1 cell division protein FtsX [Clostridium oryzae]